VLFVTRLKDDAEYGVVQARPVAEGSGVVRDEVILLSKTQEDGPEARLRRIEVRVADPPAPSAGKGMVARPAASRVQAAEFDYGLQPIGAIRRCHSIATSRVTAKNRAVKKEWNR
jgi:hypothetical protein